MEKFNKQNYIKEYRKKYYKAFKVDLRIEEANEIEKILKNKNISKVDFIRDAIKKIKEVN